MRVISQNGGVVVEALALSLRGNEEGDSWEVLAHTPVELNLYSGKHGLHVTTTNEVHVAWYMDIWQAYDEIKLAAACSVAHKFSMCELADVEAEDLPAVLRKRRMDRHARTAGGTE